MILKNSISIIYEFLFIILREVRKLYLNSSIYNKKISKIDNKVLNYRPT